MTDTTDTSAEAVERLIAGATSEAWEVDAAATLRALLAERDEAQAEANAGRQAEQDADRERDEAMAERDRLREVLEDIAKGVANGPRCHAIARAALKETGHE
jgi:hypothetical protein